ncbi:hypothetical protein HN51_036567, partial [Arachis hypogaea]
RFFVFVVLSGKAPRSNRPAATQISGSPTEKAILSWAVKADNGLSMSIQETEVAKESYDIIILDDNLASVVKFQLTVNIAALVMNVVATNVSRLNFTPCALARSFRESLKTNVMWRNLIIQPGNILHMPLWIL